MRSAAPPSFSSVASRAKVNACCSIGASSFAVSERSLQGFITVPVNTDPAAPIFSSARLGVVMDCRAFVSALADELRRRRTS